MRCLPGGRCLGFRQTRTAQAVAVQRPVAGGPHRRVPRHGSDPGHPAAEIFLPRSGLHRQTLQKRLCLPVPSPGINVGWHAFLQFSKVRQAFDTAMVTPRKIAVTVEYRSAVRPQPRCPFAGETVVAGFHLAGGAEYARGHRLLDLIHNSQVFRQRRGDLEPQPFEQVPSVQHNEQRNIEWNPHHLVRYIEMPSTNCGRKSVIS